MARVARIGKVRRQNIADQENYNHPSDLSENQYADRNPERIGEFRR